MKYDLRNFANFNFVFPTRKSLPLILNKLFAKDKIPFVFIIDEWDCVFRLFKDDCSGQEEYLLFLRDMLKEQPYVALDYATGILPVKKYGEHSTFKYVFGIFNGKSADTALEQIREKHYTEKLNAFSGEILLVGISYDENKGHSCVIEKILK